MNAKEQPLISVIVPVYKVEKYLPACLDSLLAQTYQNFELLLVDDGSPDKCWEILQQYAAQDARVAFSTKKTVGCPRRAILGWMWQGANTSALWIPTTLCCRSIWNGCTMPCAVAALAWLCAATAVYRKTSPCGQ